jgi:lipopolysaccharide export system protein LptA
MALDPKRLRRWFAATAVVLLFAVIGFYAYARYRVQKTIADIPEKLGVEVQQSTDKFTFTRSVGGRKQFSISAGKAVQLKQGQRAILNDVRIIVYGRGTASSENSDIYDQIYGKEFEYDPQAKIVKANGEVHIDLERRGTPPDDPTQDAHEEGAIHLKTSGLTFNQNTGMARTAERIEFSFPQASGSAVGATYNSEDRSLTLESQVKVNAAPNASHRSAVNMNAAAITADHAVITDSPRKVDLTSVRIEQDEREFDAQHVQIFLRNDSTVERATATGNVNATLPGTGGSSDTRIHATAAMFDFGLRNALQNVSLTGGVTLQGTGNSPVKGSAGKVILEFTGRNQIAKVRATENVRFQQPGAQATALAADAVDFFMRSRGGIERAITSGASQLELTQANQVTTVTAGKFDARFAANNRISSVKGEPNAKVVFGGATPRTSTSREVVATFNPRGARSELESVEQIGDFQFSEGARSASSDRARYTPVDEVITLQGSPRIQDKQSGLALTAHMVRLNRRSGEATAEGDVKTTYNQMKAAPSGALLASGEPVHVTSSSARAGSSGQARFFGGARLWQGANIIQAPTIEFDRNRRWLQASAPNAANNRVTTVFAQTDKTGKTTPVTVRAGKLTYSDPERIARYEGGVNVKTVDGTMTAQQVTIHLQPAGSGAGGISQLDRIIATGNLVFEQQNPARRVAGEQLVYTASDGKFVLSGTSAKSPSIFDAERGQITGDSLTFYSRDDRVQVGSGENSRTVTKTRIKDETRP